MTERTTGRTLLRRTTATATVVSVGATTAGIAAAAVARQSSAVSIVIIAATVVTLSALAGIFAGGPRRYRGIAEPNEVVGHEHRRLQVIDGGR